MDVKYLSDDKGKITGVFIPIDEWNRLQKAYKLNEDPPVDSGAQLQQELLAALKKVKPEDAEA